jgi:RNA polymerase sigma-70 factor (ECF subfamily)
MTRTALSTPCRGAPTSAAVSDEELLRRYREEHDWASFEQLVRRYERELYNYLRRYLDDPVLAEDAFQATFLQVHLKCDTFDPDRKFRPWLYTIATNQAIDVQRRNRRHRLLSLERAGASSAEGEERSLLDVSVQAQSGPEQQLAIRERIGEVRRAVAALPEALRRAVELIYYQGLKYREAAEVLGVPVGTVKSRVHAAVTKLGEKLKLGSDQGPGHV